MSWDMRNVMKEDKGRGFVPLVGHMLPSIVLPLLPTALVAQNLCRNRSLRGGRLARLFRASWPYRTRCGREVGRKITESAVATAPEFVVWNVPVVFILVLGSAHTARRDVDGTFYSISLARGPGSLYYNYKHKERLL